ncbi:hypothetical protein APY04_2861 [Hyphomicrobium sulfonivorans]|uniref:Uncharacterized protein n=1 Tax=Hyphomicrobium sulfonivorans TaxID=121290 RepID=A0A120CTZ5_HYPSL|nr:hypothetical protein APY04_2861 [Hyphomicrobium sulfonivorans]
MIGAADFHDVAQGHFPPVTAQTAPDMFGARGIYVCARRSAAAALASAR